MHKLVQDLLSEIRNLKDSMRSGKVTEDNIKDYLDKIIRVLIDIYKDETITFVVPTGDYQYIYDNVDKKYLIPFYTSKNAVKKVEDDNLKEMSFKELAKEIYDNYFYYEYVKNPESAIDNGLKLSEIFAYASGHPELSGLLLNPDTVDLYPIDSWMVKTVMFKSIGADTISFYDENGDEFYKFDY